MQQAFLKYFLNLQCLTNGLVRSETGQDLIEYALVVALIALAATVSMQGVASAIASAFTAVGTKLGTYTS